MRYTVICHPSAQDDLARIWIQASDRQAVADAADAMEQWLKRSPETVGTPVNHGPERCLVMDPLVMIFTVHPEDCFVRIAKIRLVD